MDFWCNASRRIFAASRLQIVRGICPSDLEKTQWYRHQESRRKRHGALFCCIWGSGKISVIFFKKRLQGCLKPSIILYHSSELDFCWIEAFSLQELIGKQVIRLLSPDLWTQYQLDCNSQQLGVGQKKVKPPGGDVRQKEGQTLKNNLSQITSKQCFFLKRHLCQRLCSLRLHFS